MNVTSILQKNSKVKEYKACICFHSNETNGRSMFRMESVPGANFHASDERIMSVATSD